MFGIDPGDSRRHYPRPVCAKVRAVAHFDVGHFGADRALVGNGGVAFSTDRHKVVISPERWGDVLVEFADRG